jgi:hypothetical protein
MNGRPSSLLLVALLAPAVVGCGAQSENFDDRDWTKDHGLQTPGAEQGEAWREVETLFGADESDVDRFEQSLRGVRHDLTMKADAKPDVRCSCLDIAIGDTRDARFHWAGSRPMISGKNMAIAVRTEGSSCRDRRDNRRPSIMAVDSTNGDVTIVIEELTFERPQALGAIIKKPSLNGELYVRSQKYKNQKLPYAVTNSGKSLCRVPTDRMQRDQIRSGRRY